MSTAARTSGGLVVDKLDVARAGTSIVRGASLVVPEGQVSVLLGTNGAGKTTLLEAISGVIPAAGGSITLGDANLAKVGRSARARMGLAHVEQGRSIFPDLTTEENLLVAGPRGAIEASFELFPRLHERRKARAALLSGGEQQMLVIAHALVNQPKVLLLDEMSLGLAPIIIKQLIPLVRQLADKGVGVLLVEQFASLALSIGDRAYVLSHGEMAYEGDCQTLIDNPDRLRELYLGASTADVPAGVPLV